jgi:hypothetical protein
VYRIIGADGKEYGPVTAEQLQQWIREGRANVQTKARVEDTTEWKTLGEFAEFAAAFSGAGAAAGIPPPIGAVDPEVLAAQILASDYTIDIGRCIGRGWELVKANFWLLIGVSFVGGLIAAGGGIPWIGPIIGLIIGGPMMGGVYALYLRRIRGQPASFGDAFIGFSIAFVPLMLAHLVSALLIGVGLVLCILPGIYLAVSWMFTLPLVIDKGIDFWPAMELSRKVVTKHWWLMFGLLIVCGLVAIAGVFACCVGIIVTAAIAQAALMYAYEDIFGGQPIQTAAAAQTL